MKDLPMYFIDLETTGLSSKEDRIIEYCIVRYHRGYACSIQAKVDPEEIEVSEPARKVNGYTKEKWKNATSQTHAYETIRLFTADSGIWVAHNVNFDLSFLRELYRRNGDKLNARRSVDTYTLAYEHLVPMGLKKLSFDEIRKFMGWRVTEHHGAYKDAWEVYRFWRQCSRMGIRRRTYTWIRSIKYRCLS